MSRNGGGRAVFQETEENIQKPWHGHGKQSWSTVRGGIVIAGEQVSKVTEASRWGRALSAAGQDFGFPLGEMGNH